MPDYMLAPIFTLVECKEDNGEGYWTWAEDIGPEGKRKIQRETLTKSAGWLFIMLGTEKPTKDKETSGRSAYLLPFSEWVKIENRLIEQGYKSIRKESRKARSGADTLLSEFRLDWNKGWVIPKGHVFWAAYKNKLKAELERIELTDE